MTDEEIRSYLPRLIEPGQRDSALWLAMALRKTDGRLTTLEIHEGHQAIARRHLAATGFESLVDARLADALEAVPLLEGPFDLVLIDAIKSDYLRYYELVLPKVRKGGVIAAHNMVSNAHDLKEFLARIKSDPAIRTEFFRGSARGLSLSYKK